MESAGPRVDIALDSQCLTYLIDALEGVGPPTDALAEQRIALVRTYLYTQGTLWITPTVEREFKLIRDRAKRDRHVSWTNTIFGVRRLNDAAAITRRAAKLSVLHGGERDCLIVAEAEDIRAGTLLTFDADLERRLAPSAELLLARPAPFWASLGVVRGATPNKVPSSDNPLADQDWWRW